ncbi:MAG TPA: hypothetical protein PK926_09270 [Spirochaetota bacterium]|nr:hypothetical protein [Spirochaetota bacterium]HPI89760.1 hypothetical protein [Spirochaetota bacterium]HPR47589.1 hypothetical protein [Spirochaetota bacterium]
MTQRISDNEDFIRVIEMMTQDNEFKSSIMYLIDLDPSKRKDVIRSIIMKMKDAHEKDSLIKAMAYFLDDEIVKQVKQVLIK